MRALASALRTVRNAGISKLILGSTLALGATLAATPDLTAETIQANYAATGNVVSVTLTIDSYSSALDLQTLSQAYQDGHDQGLVDALSKTKAVGHCSIAGALGYDIAFIQMVVTPTGRRITFITNRPHQLGEANPDSASASPAPSPAFDLAVGQFDINDTDAAKSTGFLFPASKLVIDKLGEFHYDLAGNPWPLVNVLDSRSAPAEIRADISKN
jgi:hypothetical protein